MQISFSLDLSISLLNIFFRYSPRKTNKLSDTDAACGAVALALCLRMYESPLHERKVKSKTTTHTPTSHGSYRVEETKIVQNNLLF